MKFRVSDNRAKQKFKHLKLSLFTETVDINNFQLHYAKIGIDTLSTLFFVHGSPGSWDAFSIYMQDKDLLAKYRMISIDRPGFGYSQFGYAKNMQEQSQIISPFLKYIDNKKPIYIIGHSLGGPLAIKLVVDNPSFFAGVVLLAASISPADEAPEKWRGLFANSTLQYLLPGAFKPSNLELWAFKKDIIPLSKQLSNITCPVWIIHGDKDKFVPVANVAYTKKMLVNAKFVETKILKGAPHFIPWEPWYKDVKNTLIQLE
ncbi:MAG: alpha/beta hydrolase [Ferruginibacter sp.]|nr:alpha/beta hydrolase [Ferruginibacter sp.]